jgi:galactokinase
VGRERAVAFAPGRVNVIGEHTDYNQGLALPFAIADGVTVRARADDARPMRIRAHACDLGERDEFKLADPAQRPAAGGGVGGWRAFVRGTAAELDRAGFSLAGAELEIAGRVPPGSGLSSSAAFEVALCLALIELGRDEPPGGEPDDVDRTELARLCARVENEWVGAQTGLLDQLASLYGAPHMALCIDFRALSVKPVALELGEWRFAVLDSGERHAHASSGYNRRRGECAQACALLGVGSLRDADANATAELPEPLNRRARHVISENWRVLDAVAAISAGRLEPLGRLLNESHASLRDDYEVSTPAVEAAVRRLLDAGAAGARVVGGGFGGIVLGLFAPGSSPPPEAREVRPSAGAHLLEG